MRIAFCIVKELSVECWYSVSMAPNIAPLQTLHQNKPDSGVFFRFHNSLIWEHISLFNQILITYFHLDVKKIKSKYLDQETRERVWFCKMF